MKRISQSVVLFFVYWGGGGGGGGGRGGREREYVLESLGSIKGQ